LAVTADPLGALFAELGRLCLLDRLEKELRRRGYFLVAGVDEVGRGSLAGPVVAAAVILPDDCVLPGLDDSKKIDAPCRERLDERVRRCALAVGIGVVSAQEIDNRDILRASLQAMREAIEGVSRPSLRRSCAAVSRLRIRTPPGVRDAGALGGSSRRGALPGAPIDLSRRRARARRSRICAGDAFRIRPGHCLNDVSSRQEILEEVSHPPR
jgi:hypothetical protein